MAKEICAQEKIKISDQQLSSIIQSSKGNVRRVLLSVEATAVANDGQVVGTDWEAEIKDISSQILKDQTPTSLLAIRAKFYDLLTHCIPPSIILKVKRHLI